MKDLGIKRIQIKTTRFIANDIYDAPNLREIVEYLKKFKELALYELKIMNALETFSTYFVQKVADEKVAFQSVGKSFCETVNNMSFSLCAVRHNESSYFENTVTLYRLWKNRFDQQNLEIQKKTLQKELVQKMNDIETKIKNTPQSNISPLGTEL